jgi:hypothetical protein
VRISLPLRLIIFLILTAAVSYCCSIAVAQEVVNSDSENNAKLDAQPRGSKALPQRVEVAPTAGDRDISIRLQKIFDATGWFTQPSVQVDEGVVLMRAFSVS